MRKIGTKNIKARQIARDLRKKGYSFREINRKTEISKGSMSIWFKDIELSKPQKERLRKNEVDNQEKMKLMWTKLTAQKYL